MDGAAFARMIVSASAAIEQKKQKINELNVFPVPDGDTGTNMSMTLAAAAQDLKKRSPESLTKAADMTASALLRGARHSFASVPGLFQIAQGKAGSKRQGLCRGAVRRCGSGV